MKLYIVNRSVFRFFMILLSVFLLSYSGALHAQTTKGMRKKKKQTWYERYEWAKDLKLTPHSSIDKEEFAKEYRAHKIWWDKAFAFLRDTDLASLTVGDHPIVGNDVFARVTEASLKSLDSSKWEAHKNYHDIHYVITGKEKIGIGSLGSASVIVPYNDKRDIAFYNGNGEFFTAEPGTFFIAFTKNIHRPELELNGKDVVKKLVIKIRSTGSQ